MVKLNLIPIPFKMITLHTESQAFDVQVILSRNIGLKHSSFDGVLTDDSFSIRTRVTFGQNDFRPVLWGKYKELESGTQIKLKMLPYWPVGIVFSLIGIVWMVNFIFFVQEESNLLYKVLGFFRNLYLSDSYWTEFVPFSHSFFSLIFLFLFLSAFLIVFQVSCLVAESKLKKILHAKRLK